MDENERKNYIPKSGTLTNMFLRKQDNIFKMHGGDLFKQGARSDEIFYKASSDSAGVFYLISDRRDDGIIVDFDGLYNNPDGTERKSLAKADISRECYPVTEFMLNAKPIFKQCELISDPDFSRCREIKMKMKKRYPVGETFNLIAEDGQHILVQRVEPKKADKPHKVGRPQKYAPSEEFVFLPILYLYNNGKNKIWQEKENIAVKDNKEIEAIKQARKACNQFTSRLRSVYGKDICKETSGGKDF